MTKHPSPLAAYSVRKVKTFIGMEGEGFNATLCRDGKPIATVIDDASGGCIDFRWIVAAEETALEAVWQQIPPTQFEGMSVTFNADTLVCCLVDQYLNDKRLKRIAKKKTLFRVKGDDPEEWRTLNIVGDKASKYLASKYGEQLETVYGHGIPSANNQHVGG
jgi:hypothetical protein